MMPDAPAARTARFDILLEGVPDPIVRSTCTLVCDGALVAVIDPAPFRPEAATPR